MANPLLDFANSLKKKAQEGFGRVETAIKTNPQQFNVFAQAPNLGASSLNTIQNNPLSRAAQNALVPYVNNPVIRDVALPALAGVAEKGAGIMSFLSPTIGTEFKRQNESIRQNVSPSAAIPKQVPLFGGLPYAELAGSFATDPSNYIPLGKAAKGASMLKRFAPNVGLNMMEGAMLPAESLKERGINTAVAGTMSLAVPTAIEGVKYGVRAGRETLSNYAQDASRQIAKDLPSLTARPEFRAFKSVVDLPPDIRSEIRRVVNKPMVSDLRQGLTIKTITKRFIPNFADLPDKKQTEVWNYLLDRIDGKTPSVIPTTLRKFEKALQDKSGKFVKQRGFIKIGPGEAPSMNVHQKLSEYDNTPKSDLDSLGVPKKPEWDGVRSEMGRLKNIVSPQKPQPIIDMTEQIAGQKSIKASNPPWMNEKTTPQEVLGQINKKLRPQHQIDIENALNKGDYTTARSIANSLPENDPYKSSMQTLLSNFDNGSSSGKKPPIKFARKEQELNVNNLGLDNAGKANVDTITSVEVKKRLKNEEITKIAQSAGIDTKTHSIDQTAQKIAEQLNARRQVVELQNKFSILQKSGGTPEQLEGILRQLTDAKKISTQQGTDIARQLQARKILANEIDTPMQKVFQLLDTAGVNPDVYLKKATSVDFDNPKQVAEFYRSLVPPKASEWLDVIRYNSMLSSPNTHINNAFGNYVGSAFIAPIEKTLTGTLDFLGSAVTGKERSAFAGEGLAYSAGYISNIRNAAHKFADVLRNRTDDTNLDTRSVPLYTKGVKSYVEGGLKFPMKMLEASDQFFTALVEGGERNALKLRQSKGVRVPDIDAEASKNAAYRLFRQDIHSPEQGVVLDAIDRFTGNIMQLRNSPNPIARNVSRWTIPFIKTPMNILKQGLEYSPAGVSTLAGASNKTEQLSKAIIGSSAMAASALLLQSGRTTWAEPTDEKKKQAFKAAGMQPYSVKIGNKWVSYSKLPPAIAFNLAFIAGLNDAVENSRLSDDDLDNILTAVAKTGNFFADQSYLKNIGDILAATKGDTESVTRFIGNYPQQLVPLRAFGGWLARATDPYQRQINKDAGFWDRQVQQLMLNIPFASQSVEPRLDAMGEPIPNSDKELNAISPLKVSTENAENKEYYQMLQDASKARRDAKDMKEMMLNDENSLIGDVSAAEGNTLAELKKKDAKDKILREQFQLIEDPAKKEAFAQKHGLDYEAETYKEIDNLTKESKIKLVSEVLNDSEELDKMIKHKVFTDQLAKDMFTAGVIDEKELKSLRAYIKTYNGKASGKTKKLKIGTTPKIKVGKASSVKFTPSKKIKIAQPRSAKIETKKIKLKDRIAQKGIGQKIAIAKPQFKKISVKTR